MTEASDLNRIENGEATSSTNNATAVPLVVEYPDVCLKVSECSVMASCPYCHQAMETEIEPHIGPFALLSAVIMAHCLLCWVPLIVDRFQDMKHSCSKCHSAIGIFKRM